MESLLNKTIGSVALLNDPPPFHDSAASFTSTLRDFSEYHKSELNNSLHYVTTPLGLAGFLSLVTAICKSSNPSTAITLAYIYLLHADPSVPYDVEIESTIILLTCLIISASFSFSKKVSIILLCAGYGLQDLAHWYTGEETFQQNTWGDVTNNPFGACVAMFFQHVFYLQPLVVATAPQTLRDFTYFLPLAVLAFGNYRIDSDSSGIPHTFARTRALFGKMSRKVEKDDMKAVRDWALRQDPPRDKTSHWWVADLGTSANKAFRRLETCDSVKDLFATKFSPDNYACDVVAGMNELYISGPCRAGTSDQVFFTEHIDGPYILFPFASIYRCIVGLDQNTEISTIFPSVHTQKAAQTGDILAFDFNREPHLIAADGSKQNKDYRIVLKLHYCVYPKNLAFFGHLLHWLTTRYNELFRALFLFTLTPTKGSFSGLVGEYAVNGGTVLYNSIDKYCGSTNLLYVFTVAAVARAVGSYTAFLIATQYIHYCRYISTYYVRKGVDYGKFKRDVLFFKSVAVMNLAWMCYSSVEWSAVGAAMVCMGYAISVSATAALGVDGTYFGIELGFVKADYQFVKSFPYNVLPHPMILSQVFALWGMHLFSGVGEARGWLIPVHTAFYLTHMTQEIFDFHDGIPWFKAIKSE